MRILFFIIVMVVMWSCPLLLNAQFLPASIYEVGKPIRTCEDNFDNLYRNWNNQNISNADQIKLLGYEYLGCIHDSVALMLYIDELLANNYLKLTSTEKSTGGWIPVNPDREDKYISPFGRDENSLIYSKYTFRIIPILYPPNTYGVTKDFFLDLWATTGRGRGEISLNRTLIKGIKFYRIYIEQCMVKYDFVEVFDAESSRLITGLFNSMPIECVDRRGCMFNRYFNFSWFTRGMHFRNLSKRFE